VNLPIAILVVLGAAAVATLALALVRRSTRGPLLADGGRGGPKIIVTGTLFAVVLAFVILAAFQTYNGAKTAGQSEAAALLDMARAAALFPPAQRDQLHAAFTCYGRAVVTQEWPAMEDGHSSPLVEHWIGEYRALYRRLDLRSTRAELAFKELLDQGATRTAGRLQRLDKATPSVPTPLWLALVFGGCVAVAVQLGLADPRERLRVEGLMVGGVASVIAAGLLIVYFLDHPYARHTGGIQPTAMHESLLLMQSLEPNLRPGCSQTGRPV
jgi:hypothetical protein